MIQVTRKDSKESVENLLRRFARKVQQSGVLAEAKSGQYFEKPLSKRDRRAKAIVRRSPQSRQDQETQTGKIGRAVQEQMDKDLKDGLAWPAIKPRPRPCALSKAPY